MFLHSRRETPDRLDADFDAAAARNAVKHDGQSRRACDGAEMLEQTFLRRLVVIRRDLERTVRADVLGALRQINRLFGRVRAGAGEHFDFAARRISPTSAMMLMCSS